MQIAVVTHKVVRGDGQGRVNYEVVKEALARGHEVTLLASEVDARLAAVRGVDWVQIPVDGWPTELIRNQVFAWRSGRWLRAHRSTFDLVMVNGCITQGTADVNAVHFVHSAWLRSPVHTSRVRRGPYAWYHKLYTALNARWERHAFRQAEVLVAVSHTVHDQIASLGVPRQKIRVIANGVDLGEFAPGSADRHALSVPAEVPLVLFVGDIRSPIKNLDTVLEALVAVPEVHLAVAGDTAGSPYPAMARQLGLGARAHFLGYRRDIPALMRAADAFVFPSRYESFSLVLLEAMASGLPVVTARTVGAADLVTPAAGVVLDDPGDARALAEAVRAVTASPERSARMGRAARAVAEQHGTARMAAQYVDLFEEQAVPASRVAAPLAAG